MKLLASAASEEKLRALIAEYFFQKLEAIKIENGVIWVNGRSLSSFRVVQNKNRFRFEGLGG